MNEVFNNREISIVIWLLILTIFVSTKKDMRKSLAGVVKAFFTPKIYMPLLTSLIPSILAIILLAYFKLWDFSMLKDTIYWVIGTGLVMFFNSLKVKDGKTLFRQTAKDSLKLIIILEFIINFYVFPIWAELLLVPFFTIVTIMTIFAKYQKGNEYDRVRKFFNGLTIFIGFAVIAFAIIDFAHNPKPLFTIRNLEIFFLPIVLSFTYVPSVYLLSLYSKYDLMFNRINLNLRHLKNRRAVKVACFKRCGFNVNIAEEMVRYLFINLTNTTTNVQAAKLVRDFRPQALSTHG